MKKLPQKIGLILSATMLAMLISMFQTPYIASAACSLDPQNPTEVKDKAKNLDDKELTECINEVQEEISAGNLEEDGATAYNTSLQTLMTEEQARIAVAPAKNYVEDQLSITDMFDEGNQCLSEEDEAEFITVSVEEPIESDLTSNENIRNCVRNTFCFVKKDETVSQCVTAELKDNTCSEQARNKAKTPGEELKSATINCQPIQVYLSKSGTDLIFLYIGTIYRWAASVIGIIAVLVIVISGIQISAAAGDQQAVTNARNRIIQSIGGLALLFLSGIILYTINPTFFTGG